MLNVDFHFVLANGEPYPINVLRNTALQHARTEFVILLDVDFKPNLDMFLHMRSFLSKYWRNLLEGTVYCIAAYEVDEGVEAPQDKMELLTLVERGVARPVHIKAASEAMRAVNFTRWETATEPYDIEYEAHFEPYILAHRSIIRYDERFKGYGWDKVSYFFEIHMSNKYRFAVVPQDFIVHLYHAPATWKKEQPLIYRRVWQNWYEFAFELYKRYHGDTFDFKKLSEEYQLDLLVGNENPPKIGTNNAFLSGFILTVAATMMYLLIVVLSEAMARFRRRRRSIAEAHACVKLHT